MYDLWKNWAVNELQSYEAQKQATVNLPERIRDIEERMIGLRSSGSDSIAVKGGGSGREDMYINCICQQAELEKSLKRAQSEVRQIERALSVLSKEEQSILRRFYIDAERGAARRLAEDLGIEEKAVYRRKDTALRLFTIAIFGK